jgi:hypothetical protein
MIIEQSREQVDDAISFHTRSEISFVRLARARVWSREQITRLIGSGDVSFDINFKPGAATLGDDILVVETDFVFAMNRASSDQAGERQPIILVECSFEAEYRYVPEYKPSERQIQAFRAANAVFNCWPFFREFVQSSIARMNYPPPPVPFLRLVRKADIRPEPLAPPRTVTPSPATHE